MKNAVYKVEYWNKDTPDKVNVEGPYATKAAAKGRLTSYKNSWYRGKFDGRVLELSGEWKEVE